MSGVRQNNVFWHTLARYWWLWLTATFVSLGVWLGFYPLRLPTVLVWIVVALLCVQGLAFVAAIIVKAWRLLAGVVLGGLASVVLFTGLLISGAVGDIVSDWAVPDQDSFGREHPVPDTLRCELPLVDEDHIYYGMNDTIGVFKKAVAPVIDSADSFSFLQVHEGTQPGIYEYDLYAPALADGYVFLKCFEVTENIRLSKQEVSECTKVPVSNHRAFGQVVTRQEFTIYEGIWDEPYAVRIEAWYHDNCHRQNHLITSKIYKLEGWMR